MLKKILVKKFGLGLVLSSLSLLCAQSQGEIITSFDTGVDVEVSSTFSVNEFETVLFDSQVFVDGSASGDASGSDDFGPVILGSDEVGLVSAAANGQVNGMGGFVQSSWETDGYLFFENNTGSDIFVNVLFDITWFAEIFTASSDEEAYATAGFFIIDSFDDMVSAEFIELDSLIKGPGNFSESDSFQVNFNFVLADGDFEEYFFIADSFGFAESPQAVPEPTGLFLAGLALLFAFRQRKLNR
ncbi:PEP-CTERM sorting domain-containing protein [Colwellia sp. MB02u-9]|uniref:PEP-CTERM sorting domain-containing protein n=1 Tax=Colwellia sp. MB02u-9 TaxID=2759823 RepID=UPI0015F386E8|nr:PEP-CTERM sorting domain-containing protein [Colwellia sp. MB02u-9]MBA6296997.1 PEP-CTERM sorting domain-containing protein [Colwellia sp. MB02u-9]